MAQTPMRLIAFFLAVASAEHCNFSQADEVDHASHMQKWPRQNRWFSHHAHRYYQYYQHQYGQHVTTTAAGDAGATVTTTGADASTSSTSMPTTSPRVEGTLPNDTVVATFAIVPFAQVNLTEFLLDFNLTEFTQNVSASTGAEVVVSEVELSGQTNLTINGTSNVSEADFRALIQAAYAELLNVSLSDVKVLLLPSPDPSLLQTSPIYHVYTIQFRARTNAHHEQEDMAWFLRWSADITVDQVQQHVEARDGDIVDIRWVNDDPFTYDFNVELRVVKYGSDGDQAPEVFFDRLFETYLSFHTSLGRYHVGDVQVVEKIGWTDASSLASTDICGDGDVRSSDEGISSGTAFAPYIYDDFAWYPVCKKDINHETATSFCKQLGFDAGESVALSDHLLTHSMQVGSCHVGELAPACTAGGNTFPTLPTEGCGPGQNGIQFQCTTSSSWYVTQESTCRKQAIRIPPSTCQTLTVESGDVSLLECMHSVRESSNICGEIFSWSQGSGCSCARRGCDSTSDSASTSGSTWYRIYPGYFFNDHGPGICTPGAFFTSESWALADSSEGNRVALSPEFMAWVGEAWVRCTEKDGLTRFVSVWEDAKFACHTNQGECFNTPSTAVRSFSRQWQVGDSVSSGSYGCGTVQQRRMTMGQGLALLVNFPSQNDVEISWDAAEHCTTTTTTALPSCSQLQDIACTYSSPRCVWDDQRSSCHERPDTAKYYLVPKGTECPEFGRVKSKWECDIAQQELQATYGYTAGRSIVVGGFADLPAACSVQWTGGRTAHWNAAYDYNGPAPPACTENWRARLASGEFREVCRGAPVEEFKCANEENGVLGLCRCDGDAFYGKRYASGQPGSGAESTFAQMTQSSYAETDFGSAGSGRCSVSAFGRDPTPGFYKHCYCRETGIGSHGSFESATALVRLGPRAYSPYVCGFEGEVCQCFGTVWYGKKHIRGQPGDGPLTTLDQLLESDHGFLDPNPPTPQIITCSPAAFGKDPNPGFYKHCICEPYDDRSINPLAQFRSPKAEIFDAPSPGLSYVCPYDGGKILEDAGWRVFAYKDDSGAEFIRGERTYDQLVDVAAADQWCDWSFRCSRIPEESNWNSRMQDWGPITLSPNRPNLDYPGTCVTLGEGIHNIQKAGPYDLRIRYMRLSTCTTCPPANLDPSRLGIKLCSSPSSCESSCSREPSLSSDRTMIVTCNLSGFPIAQVQFQVTTAPVTICELTVFGGDR
ncbi:unnamed protein product [Symbiodinium sp. CCMP2592]|nr:unnamed protein product [Symbiodinium sp. CCMP2592]